MCKTSSSLLVKSIPAWSQHGALLGLCWGTSRANVLPELRSQVPWGVLDFRRGIHKQGGTQGEYRWQILSHGIIKGKYIGETLSYGTHFFQLNPYSTYFHLFFLFFSAFRVWSAEHWLNEKWLCLLSGLWINWKPKKFLGPCFGGTQKNSVASNDLCWRWRSVVFILIFLRLTFPPFFFQNRVLCPQLVRLFHSQIT